MGNDDLSQYLESLERLERYQVDSTIKSSELEETHLVFREEADGSKAGPFVRKTIKRDSGLGAAYERIFAAQQAGTSFSHIPTIRECCRSETSLVVVMDYVKGETLQDLIYRHDPSLELVEHIFPSICDAVSELHEGFDPPLIHRDLKPSNTMIAKGHAYIIDFGIARNLKEDAPSDTAYYGTRAYAPPEQFGYGQTTQKSDIYSLGMLLYFCLVEKTPDARLVQQRFNDPAIPEQLQRVLNRACAFDPANRYESAREMKQDLQSALASTRLAGEPAPQAASEAAGVAPSAVPGATAVSPAAASQANPGAPSPAEAAAVGAAAIGMAAGMVDGHRDGMAAASIQAAATPPPPKQPRYHGKGYNVAVMLTGILFCASCIMNMLDPSATVRHYPYWASAIAFFMLGICSLATAFAATYKERLKERWPGVFGIFTRRFCTNMLLICWGALIFVLAVFVFIFPDPA